jgi:hypothetical protein
MIQMVTLGRLFSTDRNVGELMGTDDDATRVETAVPLLVPLAARFAALPYPAAILAAPDFQEEALEDGRVRL